MTFAGRSRSATFVEMGRADWLAWMVSVAALACVSACGGTARRGEPEQLATDGGRDGTGGAGRAQGGTPAQPFAGSGGAVQGSENGGMPSHGGRSGSGGAVGGGANGAGAGGVAAAIPAQSEEETEIVSVLDTDDETIDAVSGDELIALTRGLGIARGYLMCRCAFSPAAPPEDVMLVDGCARDENAAAMVATDAQVACIGQRMEQVLGFEDYLRCVAKRARELAWFEASICWTMKRPDVAPAIYCEAPAGADELVFACHQTMLCADGSLVDGQRCDEVAQCPGLFDERDCYDYVGRDQIECDGQLLSPYFFCADELSSCPTIEPPICDLSRPRRFLCGDGSDVGSQAVCDRVSDCSDDRDESLCLR